MERALGEVPHVVKIVWDWREQTGWLRFAAGEAPPASAITRAITRGTMYTAGQVTFIDRVEELPDALR